MKVSPMTTLEQAADRIARRVSLAMIGENGSTKEALAKAALLEYGNLVGAEIERLRKDAWRYQWLEQMWPTQLTRLVHSHHLHGPTSTELGPAIDAAMAQVKEKA